MELTEEKRDKKLKIGIGILSLMLAAVIICFCVSFASSGKAATNVNTTFPQLNTAIKLCEFHRIHNGTELAKVVNNDSDDTKNYLYLGRAENNSRFPVYYGLTLIGDYEATADDTTIRSKNGKGLKNSGERVCYGEYLGETFYSADYGWMPSLERVKNRVNIIYLKYATLVTDNAGTQKLRLPAEREYCSVYRIRMRSNGTLTSNYISCNQQGTYTSFLTCGTDTTNANMILLFADDCPGPVDYDTSYGSMKDVDGNNADEMVEKWGLYFDVPNNSLHIIFRNSSNATSREHFIVTQRPFATTIKGASSVVGCPMGVTQLGYLDSGSTAYNFYMWLGQEISITRGINGDSYVPSGQTLINQTDEMVCIPAGTTLVIQENATLIVKGTMFVYGKIKNYGTIVIEDGGTVSCLTDANGKYGVIENYAASYLKNNTAACRDGDTNKGSTAEGEFVILSGGRLNLSATSVCFYNYGGTLTNMGILYNVTNYDVSGWYGYQAYGDAIFRQYTKDDECLMLVNSGVGIGLYGNNEVLDCMGNCKVINEGEKLSDYFSKIGYYRNWINYSAR